MVVYTDSIDYARLITGQPADRWSKPDAFENEIQPIAEAVFEDRPVFGCALPGDLRWRHLLIVEQARRSQYDLLIDLGRRAGALPGDVLLLAGAGASFHGFKGRPWSARMGNIHLSVCLAPPRTVERPGTSFTVLAAVSVIDAIDAVPGLEGAAGIKWVNDVLIDGAKVGGVLSYTHGAEGAVTGAVLGIGLNVETDPVLDPTPFVPRAGSLLGLTSRPRCCSLQVVLARLIAALDRNVREMEEGRYAALLDRYRRRSLVVGRDVSLCTEDSGSDPEVLASGRVTRLGDDLELSIEGFNEPFTKGRLVLEPQLEPQWTPLSSS